ncbi:hypothetical protein PMAYCL1PPCAC_08980, partial [Pristionchus mayeri]
TIVLFSTLLSGLSFTVLLVSFPILKDELDHIDSYSHNELALIREQSDYLWKELLSLGVDHSPEGLRKARALSTAAYVAPPAPPS